MKNISTKFLSTFLVATLLVTGVSLAAAYNDGNHMPPSLSQEQKEVLRDARDTGDFAKVHELLEEYGIKRGFSKRDNRGRGNLRMTDEQKQELRSARDAGDFEKVRDLIKEHGINQGGKIKRDKQDGMKGERGMDRGHREMFQNLTEDQQTALKEAKGAGNFDKIHELMEEFGIEMPNKEAYENLTDDQKQALKDAHDAKDFEKINELKEEYGIKMGHKKMGGMRDGNAQGRGGRKGGGSHDSRVILENIPESDLSDAERELLIAGQQEERLAQDVYAYLAGKYDVQVFSNISQSETQHIASIGALLDRYEIEQTEGYGPYTDLYTELTAKGELSLKDAIEVGITIEVLDITDLDETIAHTDNEDIKTILGNLRKASVRHLSAFVRQLEVHGFTTDIDYLDYLEEMENEGHWGGRGRGNRDGRSQEGSGRWNQ